MSRRKIPEDKKKVNYNITLDPELSKIFEKFLDEIEVYNRSKYIENMIKELLIKNKKI